MRQTEFDFVVSRLNISFAEMWRMSYANAKKSMPKRCGDTAYQYYRDLGISTLYEFAEQVKQKADEMTRIAIDEDH